MAPVKKTIFVMFVIVFLLIAYDVVINSFFGYKATLSQVIYDTVSVNSWIALFAGFFLGRIVRK